MKISKEARKLSKELLKHSFKDGALNPAAVKAMTARIVADKPRYYMAVLKEYQRLIRLEVGKHHAIVESAESLDRVTSEELEKSLRSKYGADLTTEFRINPELIGGLRIKLGSNVWDSSVRGRLNRLENQLAHS